MKKIVLIVEDDEVHGKLLAQIIAQETPHQPIVASQAMATLKFVQHVKPDLLILDYLLPRMDGLELYDQLQKMPGVNEVPVLLISASLPCEEVERRGIVGMKKPFELDAFLETIERLLV
ncbi:MAG TPA: response regulator [Ktedonobacteraceae bacterium]|nr:response regulator [Ktedonobacteraceae bacterium]